ncbi:MAG: hypothetical protein PHT19_08245 [Methylococcus sp.]|nr:hypothetical protein [Methylococcus sp.]
MRAFFFDVEEARHASLGIAAIAEVLKRHMSAEDGDPERLNDFILGGLIHAVSCLSMQAAGRLEVVEEALRKSVPPDREGADG